MTPEFYDEVMDHNIRKDYAEADPDELREVNYDAAKLAEGLGIADRAEVFLKKSAFVNYKDTKPNLSTAAAPKEVPVRVITPSKSQLGRVAKIKLQKLNAQVRSATKANQWRQTRDATKWFEGLPTPTRGKNYYFFQFDFLSFYGSIKETLLKKALQRAVGLEGVVAEDDFKLYLNASKSLSSSEGSYLGPDRTKQTTTSILQISALLWAPFTEQRSAN